MANDIFRVPVGRLVRTEGKAKNIQNSTYRINRNGETIAGARSESKHIRAAANEILRHMAFALKSKHKVQKSAKRQANAAKHLGGWHAHLKAVRGSGEWAAAKAANPKLRLTTFAKGGYKRVGRGSMNDYT
jgi:hypothetical protein